VTKYLVYIERVGDPISAEGLMAHVPALPGASARGETIEEAAEKIEEAIENYLRLLREAGEPVPRVKDGIYLEIEAVDTTTFPTDYDALRPIEMETLFRWLALSRQELMNLVKDLPEEALKWKAEAQSPSIQEILYRIAEADLWYTDRLKRWPDTVISRLAAARGVALERLRALTEADLTGITIYDGQKWTPRKILRRMLELEREQTQQIRDILAAQDSG